ncbi:BREX-1 system adenine-specific DNA-methyltransferase PglX [Levilactobacillus sp. HBUAS67488]|uniref:BREX-1 system adenine-specific DNA-methyltransferase PglX n=1 Tax=Levilactobacillus sp. HBUAS67488 TaxID=3109361 RepID=UPI002FF432C5
MIQHLITDISEDDFNVAVGGQVEIIGWLYQYYNTEPKNTVISMPKSHKFRDTEIASATQIFTPDWIVKYMVQNSLGKYWIKHLLAVGSLQNESEIAREFNWQYYMPDAKQPDNVQSKIETMDSSLKELEIKQLKMIDPSMGSGHILIYAFDVLMQIYESEGYSRREASESIIKHNLNGLDIDTRAFQLSYFAVMMKARQYNRRALTKITHMNVYDIPGTDDFKLEDFEILLSQLSENSSRLLRHFLQEFTFGNELGSLILEYSSSLTSLREELDALNHNQLSFELIPLLDKVADILNSVELLGQKYQVVITNPPYMGSSRMESHLLKFAKKNYPNSKADLFAMFIERWNKALVSGGYNAMVTMQSWMFLSSFEKMRVNLLGNYTISNLMHMENNVMGIAFGTAVTIVRDYQLPSFIGTYHQIKTADVSGKIPQHLPIADNRFNRTNQANFAKIPGMPIAYWASQAVISNFINGSPLLDVLRTVAGGKTGNNGKFIRLWSEINYSNFGVNSSSRNIAWVPYNKGGNRRLWYGNNEYVVYWENNGEVLKNYRDKNGNIKSRMQSPYLFYPGITWSVISSGKIGVRYQIPGSIADMAAAMFLGDHSTSLRVMALLNSVVGLFYVRLLSPTINLKASYIEQIPWLDDNNAIKTSPIDEQINLAKCDWDSFETSWDFTRHPLLSHIADDNLSHCRSPVG